MTLVRVPPPWRGLDLDSAPDSVSSDRGQVVRNLIVGRPGRMPVRAPVGARQTTVAIPNGAAGAVAGAGGFWIYQGYFLHSLGTATGTLYSSQIPGTFSTGVAASIQLTPSFTAMQGYAVGATCSTAGVPGYLLAWDTTPSTLVYLTNGPNKPVAVASHQTRCFALNGTCTSQPFSAPDNCLFWTIPNPDLTTNALASWKDATTGIVNQMELPANDTWVDLVTFNRTLYVIGRRSVLAITGDTPASYSIRKVLDVGSSTSLSGMACAGQNGLYFMSTDGLVRFDGASSAVLSGPVRPVAVPNGAGLWAQVATLPDGFISLIVRGRWLVLHEPTGAWADFTVGEIPSSTLHGVARLPAFVRRWTDSSWAAFDAADGVAVAAAIDISYITRPEMYLAQIGSIIQVDGGGAFLIDAQATSAEVRLGTPERKAMVERLYSRVCGASWRVIMDSAELGTQLGTMLDDVGTTQWHRAQGDQFVEAESIQVRWQMTSTATNMTPSIGPVDLKIAAAQQR